MKKLVLVSGSGRGLGSSIARSFVANDYKVAINYFKSEEKAHKLCDELGNDAYAFYANVSNKSEVEKMIAEIENKFSQLPYIQFNINLLIGFIIPPIIVMSCLPISN